MERSTAIAPPMDIAPPIAPYVAIETIMWSLTLACPCGARRSTSVHSRYSATGKAVVMTRPTGLRRPRTSSSLR
ncbi:hypothetical protein [Nonomuraea typhae]|uniref:hypothetical protein n=1 Tax=Nonomuraea typhae TaxID=2603600 RepID=UPI0015E241F1|nr:hypothetical protein [Nonomuraea typhae]